MPARCACRCRRCSTRPIRNTIPLADQPQYPGNLEIESRIGALVRWNALAMVVHANKVASELGGHIATYASVADMFEVGYNHFFRAGQSGDLVYFQPHAAPGMYARAWLEGRLTQEHLENYRQETGGKGLSSYCHPWLMPSFWQFPTGSMGLGPITAIYQARFLRYLENRGLLDTKGRKVWEFVGDGEMDEPESLAGLSLAAREGLDNLIFVVNCNLQRLDGPVRGNGSIIQELEGLFAGAGWNVIKVLWGSDWDPLFARDHENIILRRLHETVDGEFQKYAATDGRFNREHFFNKYPELQKLVAHLSDEDIDRLQRGGHDPVKIYAAYHAAVNHKGQPTVILAQTKKGYGMGHWGQGRMTAHQQKKLEDEALLAFRDRFALPLSDEDVRNLRFVQAGGRQPGDEVSASAPAGAGRLSAGAHGQGRSAARAGAREHGEVPGGHPGPRAVHHHDLRATAVAVAQGSATSASASCPSSPTKRAPSACRRCSARWRSTPRWASSTSRRTRTSCSTTRKPRNGQILEEGITEAGAISSWIAAATSYSAHGVPMLPFYIFYSCFGFQRIGDLDLGRGRFARARLPARRHRRPHHALRRRPAARGRLQPPAVLHRAQLRGLRSLLRLRADGDPAGRHAPHARESGGRVLLRHGDERELRASRRCPRAHAKGS